jgi:hypothetical protein
MEKGFLREYCVAQFFPRAREQSIVKACSKSWNGIRESITSDAKSLATVLLIWQIDNFDSTFGLGGDH